MIGDCHNPPTTAKVSALNGTAFVVIGKSGWGAIVLEVHQPHLRTNHFGQAILSRDQAVDLAQAILEHPSVRRG